jgi:hypothetical protein
VSADPHDDADRAESDQHHERDQPRFDADALHPGGVRGLGRGVELLARPVFVSVRLHGANFVQRFVDVGRNIGNAILVDSRQATHVPSHQQDRDDRRRYAEHDQRRELDARQEQQHERADHHETVAQEHRKSETDDLPHLLGIVREARRKLSRARRVEETGREGEDLRKNGLPQIGDHALADAHHQIKPRPRRRREYESERDDSQETDVQQALVTAAETGIDDMPQSLAEREHAARGDHERDERDRYARAIRPQEAGEAKKMGDVGAGCGRGRLGK